MLFATTERFYIHRHTIPRDAAVGVSRDVYQAWYRADDIPRPVCIVTVFDTPAGLFVEWIETSEGFRRQRIASEVLGGIRHTLKQELVMEGATPAGEAFVDHFESVVRFVPLF